MSYVVTNVRLEASLLRSIKERALERRVPASVIIREAITKYLAADDLSKRDYERAWDELFKACGKGRQMGEARAGSTDIDDVLYASGSRRTRRSRKRG